MAKCYILGFVGQTWCLDALHEFLISPELSSDKKLRFCLGCNSSTVLLSYEENPALFFFFFKFSWIQWYAIRCASYSTNMKTSRKLNREGGEHNGNTRWILDLILLHVILLLILCFFQPYILSNMLICSPSIALSFNSYDWLQ